MSEVTPEETPEQTVEQPETAAETRKPWEDGDFNAEKAWNLISGLRADKERLSARETLTPELKARLGEYDRLVEASKTDAERRDEALSAATERVGALQGRLAAAEIKAALTGVVPDVDAFLEDLNVGKFVNADGDVDVEAIAALRTKYAGFAAPSEKPGMRPNPSQGRSASPAPTVHDQIAQAQAAGDIKSVMRLKAAQALSSSDN